MLTGAWVSIDGESYKIREHEGVGLMAWWRTLPKIVGIMVLFPDGTRHSMEASEFYAVLPVGEDRERFWNGDVVEMAPNGAHVIAGIEVPDAVYETASVEMGNWNA